MVKCACNKTIDKVPNWLEGVKVQFVCNNCPNRTIKGITEVTLPATIKETSIGALDEGFDLSEEEEGKE
jgi:predicted RNA-binding protein with PUA-like domain